MRTHAVVAGLMVIAALGALGGVGPAGAESKSKKVDEITCEEFLAMSPEDREHIAYWVDGYLERGEHSTVGTVAFDKFHQPIVAIVDECKVTPKETLWQKLKRHL
jgi:hypothetical protein